LQSTVGQIALSDFFSLTVKHLTAEVNSLEPEKSDERNANGTAPFIIESVRQLIKAISD